jgi:hypothetical protein
MHSMHDKNKYPNVNSAVGQTFFTALQQQAKV